VAVAPAAEGAAVVSSVTSGATCCSDTGLRTSTRRPDKLEIGRLDPSTIPGRPVGKNVWVRIQPLAARIAVSTRGISFGQTIRIADV
jgi:hypothetical protein